MATFAAGTGSRHGRHDERCDTAADALRRLPRPRSATPEVWAAAAKTNRTAQSSSKQIQDLQRILDAGEPDCELEGEPDDIVETRPNHKAEDFRAEAALCAELRGLIQAEEAELQEKRFMVQAAQRSLQNFLGISNADHQELALLQEEWAEEQQMIAEWMHNMDDKAKALLEAAEHFKCQEEEMRQIMPQTPAPNVANSKAASQIGSESKAQLNKMEEQQTLLVQRIATLRKESKQYSEDREKLTGKIESIRSERRSLQAGIKAARRSCVESECRELQMIEMADADVSQMGKLESQVSQLRAEVEDLSAKVSIPPPDPSDAVCKQLQEKVVQLRKDLGARRTEVSLLKEELAKQQKL